MLMSTIQLSSVGSRVSGPPAPSLLVGLSFFSWQEVGENEEKSGNRTFRPGKASNEETAFPDKHHSLF